MQRRKQLIAGAFSYSIIALTTASASVAPVVPLYSKSSLKREEANASLTIEAAFSPGKAEEKIIEVIESAKKSLKIAAYVFTNPSIMKAVLDAHDKGVSIQVIVDSKQEDARFSCLKQLLSHRIPFRINEKYAIMHHKFMVVDDITVETGSFNYSTSAARLNAENAIFIKNEPRLAKTYTNEWKRLWSESRDVAINRLRTAKNACPL